MVMIGVLWSVTGSLGCITGGTGRWKAADEPEEYPLLWERSGHDRRIRRGFRFVAHSARDLALVPLAAPPVDFGTQMVLIVSPGPVRSAETEIRIRRIWPEDGRLRCQIDLIQGVVDETQPLKLHSPYHLVVVPQSPRNIEGFSTTLPPGAFVSGKTG